MEITEEDIFIYVFYPSSLTSTKRKYIDNNLAVFQSHINFYQQLNTPLDSDSKISLKNKVNEYFSECQIELLPYQIKSMRINGIKLAAASEELDNISNVKCFADDNHHYLIRIVSDAVSTKLYFLPAVDISLPIKIQFYPSGSTYEIYDISEPTLIVEERTLEKICVKKT